MAKRKIRKVRRSRWKIGGDVDKGLFPIPEDVMSGYICCWLTLMMFEIEPPLLQKFGSLLKQYKKQKGKVLEHIKSSLETIKEIAIEDGEDIKEQETEVRKTIAKMAAKIWGTPLEEIYRGIQSSS